MKICLVAPGYSPDGGDGIAAYAGNLATALVAAGHAVHIIARSSRPGDDSDTIHGVRVHRLGPKALLGLERYLPGIPWSAAVAGKIAEIERSDGVDIVEFPDSEGPGLWYLRSRGHRPAVVRVHAPRFEQLRLDKPGSLPSIGERFICWQERESCLLANAVTCSTDHYRQYMAAAYSIVPSKIEVIPLGLPEPVAEEARAVGDHASVACRVLYLSRLEPRKGVRVLIDAIPLVLERHPHTEFVFVGKDGPHAPGGSTFKEYLRERFPACQAKVRFVGHVPGSDTPSYYRNADIFAVPSFYESFGLVYVEAMFYGLPVIGGRAGGIPEIIDDDRNGFLVEVEDCQDLAGKLIRLIEDPALRRSLGEHALSTARRRFHVEVTARQTSALYRKIVDQAGGARSSKRE